MGADYPVGNCRNRPLGHRSLLRHFSGFVIYYKNFPEALPARTFILTFLSGGQPIIGAGWTLEFEVFFYAATAMAIAIATSSSRWSLVVYALVTLAMIGRFMPCAVGELSVLVDPYLIEFVYGLIAAEIFCTRRLPVFKLAATVARIAVT